MENYERTVAELETLREEKNELEMYRIQTGKDMEEMRREIKAMAQAQVEWKNTVVQLQNDRNQREQEWLDKEKSWETAKLEWEKTIAELEKVKAEAHAVMAQVVSQPAPMNAVTPSASPEAAKALTAIRQQMQEMQTLLVWLRPAKKQPPLGKAA
jgi:DNA repair exonuclease SbcCD ATPase subunit